MVRAAVPIYRSEQFRVGASDPTAAQWKSVQLPSGTVEAHHAKEAVRAMLA